MASALQSPTGMFASRVLLTIGVCLLATACGSDEPIDSNDEKSDVVVDYFLPDAATDIDLTNVVSASITYGRCERTEAPDGVDINIDCGTPWTEVSWYRISAEEIADSVEIGATTLYLDFGVREQEEIIDRLRVSVHELNDEGKTRKLASETGIYDGDSMSVVLQGGVDYYIYVARDGTPLTSTRTAEYSFTPTMQSSEI